MAAIKRKGRKSGPPARRSTARRKKPVHKTARKTTSAKKRAVRARRRGGILGFLSRWVFNEQGVALVEYALVFPILIMLTFGVLEFGLLIFENHRASEATRRGAREATIQPPIANLTNLSTLGKIACGSAGGAVSCGGQAVTNAAAFTAIYTPMQAILTRLKPENLRVTYAHSGLGVISSSSGILPQVTVEVVNLNYNYLVGGAFPGIDNLMTMRPQTTAQIMGSYKP